MVASLNGGELKEKIHAYKIIDNPLLQGFKDFIADSIPDNDVSAKKFMQLMDEAVNKLMNNKGIPEDYNNISGEELGFYRNMKARIPYIIMDLKTDIIKKDDYINFSSELSKLLF